jgi:uncharacterized protein YdcH (DUF465 family)
LFLPALSLYPNQRAAKEAEMPNRDDLLKEELLRTDDEFRRLYEEHKEYERRLQELNHKSLLSEEDEAEEKKIKLHKLVLKDHMEEILRHHRESRVTA